MTGKELIIYILENDLENKKIIGDDFSKLFITVEEAACKMGYGVATVKALIDMGKIPGFQLLSSYYVLKNKGEENEYNK